ncbi:MAG: hypothetical protein KGM42_18685 [Hyphomicrobiales bacterium]|nr:hypothetical protein [Hyphomicrobiales bacterium]
MIVPDWLKHPKWKWLRPPLGALLIFGGALGFLPVLGFWMIPLGIAILAIDFPAARRAEAWMAQKWRSLCGRLRRWRSKK